jgi:hypothetical protein
MKYLSVLLLAISLSIYSFAQDNKFEIGMQGGPNISSLRFQNQTFAVKNNSLVAFSGGLFFQYNLNKTFSLRADPGFERKGYHYNYNYNYPLPNISNEKVRESFNYLTIPVLLRASIGNKIRYFINAGPYIGFLLSEKERDTPPNQATLIYNNTNYYTKTDLGITAGIGLAIPIKDKFALSLEIRNNLGLMNINNNTFENGSDNIKTNSTNLLIGFAYKFGAKK